MHYFDGMSTPIGRIHIVVSDMALTNIYFPTEVWTGEFMRRPKHPLIVAVKKQLSEYFKGERKIFDLPLDPTGTAFQKRVWEVLCTIPYGQTISYSIEAIRPRNPLSVRAAGSANGKNPIPIIVPCHRVITKNGALGGYRGGVQCKAFLLYNEQKYLAREG